MFQSGEFSDPHASSESDVVPADGVVHERIEAKGIRELTIVVLGVQSSLGVEADIDEVLDMEVVGEVHVEVVLDVLNLVQPFLNESVSPDSGEREGLVVKFPGVNSDMRVKTLMGFHLTIDEHSGIVVLSIEVSGEQVDFFIELSLGDIDGRLARGSELLLNNRAVDDG